MVHACRDEWVRLVLTRQLLGGEPLPWQLHRLQALKALWGPVVASWRAGGLTQKETRVHQQLAGSFSSYLAGHVLTFHTSFSALVLPHMLALSSTTEHVMSSPYTSAT
jgi:hypothetical protein